MKKNLEIDIVLAPLKYGANVDGIELGPDFILEDKTFVYHILLKFSKVSEKGQSEKMKFLNTVLLANSIIYKTVKKIIKVGNFPLIIGGDHSVAIGSISAASECIDNLGVIWIDAHGDMNTEDITMSGNIHGMPLAILQGLGNKKLTDLVVRKIKTENIVVFGTRDLDKEEEKLMKLIGLNYFSFKSICENGFKSSFKQAVSYLKQKTDKLHISFDLDSMDPKTIKGVSTPVLKGFKSGEVQYMLKELFRSFFVTSMDIVEYNPKFDTDGKTLLELIQINNNVHEYLDKFSNTERE